MNEKEKIRIMLVDDHVLIRSGLTMLLQKHGAVQVVGEAADGLEALRLYEQLRPDILLLDLSLPRMDGITCLREIKERDPAAKVIVLSMHEDEDYICAVINAGAVGYVPKAAMDEELFDAIDAVRHGHFYLRPQEAHTLVNTLKGQREPEADPLDPYVLLSSREREVLRFLVQGYTQNEIAQEMAISAKTVDTYKSRIMTKLNAKRKSELFNYALKYRLIADR